MKKYIEIQEKLPTNTQKEELKNRKGCLLFWLLGNLFPYRPNEHDKVKYWVLEFECNDWNYKYEVKREIGLDENKTPVLKLPNSQNELGFWGDEDVDYDYFKNHFEVKEISSEIFLKLWNV